MRKNVLLVCLAVVGLFVAGITQGATPVIHWSFDNTPTNSGSGGSSYDATLVNGPVYTTGVVGTAGISLDGVDDYVSVNYTLPDQGSIALWYYAKPWYNFQSIFDNSADGNQWEMWIGDSGEIASRIKYLIGNCTFDLDNLNSSNHWYHLVYIWDKAGDIARLYVNGSERASDTIDAGWVNPGATFYLGGGNAGNTSGNGTFDDVRIYDSVLSASEVQDLFGDVLAVHIKFDGDTADSAPGTNNPAVLFGNSSFVDGMDGQALELQQTATQDYAQIDYHLSDQGSLSFWYYAAGPFVSYNTIFDNSSDGNEWEMWSDVNGAVWGRIVGDYGRVGYDLDNINSSNHWYHLVYTWNKTGDIARLYVNGKERDTDAIGAGWVEPGRYVYLGGGHTGNTQRNGRWDDFRIYNRELTAAEVRDIFGEFEAVYLPFDGDAIDQAGGDNSAVYYGDPQYVNGPWNQALACDGTDDYAAIDYQLPDQGTIALWYYAKGPWYNYQSIFDNSLNGDYWEMWIDSAGLLRARIHYTEPDYVTYDLDNLDGPNNWYHIAFSWDRAAAETKLFVNGVERDSDTIDNAWVIAGRYLYIAGGHTNNANTEGKWDELHVYNRALTESEVSVLAEYPPPRGTLILVK